MRGLTIWGGGERGRGRGAAGRVVGPPVNICPPHELLFNLSFACGCEAIFPSRAGARRYHAVALFQHGRLVEQTETAPLERIA